MGINYNKIAFEQRISSELDESLYKLSPLERKKIFLDLKRQERIRLQKEEEKRLEKLKKD